MIGLVAPSAHAGEAPIPDLLVCEGNSVSHYDDSGELLSAEEFVSAVGMVEHVCSPPPLRSTRGTNSGNHLSATVNPNGTVGKNACGQTIYSALVRSQAYDLNVKSSYKISLIYRVGPGAWVQPGTLTISGTTWGQTITFYPRGMWGDVVENYTELYQGSALVERQSAAITLH